jgi:hypothetical protein
MLEMSGALDFRQKILRGAYGNSNPGLISTEFIGRYQQVVAKDEIHFMQQLVGRRMKTFGYQLDEIKLTAGEALKYYTTTFPDNLMRFSSWLALEKLQRLYPAQFGKTPPRDKIKLVNA